jgi:hypothetical protein
MRFAGKRTWKNIRGQVDGKVTQYRTILIRLRDDFLARAAVTTEVTVLRIQDDVSRIQDDVSDIVPDRQELLDSILKIHSLRRCQTKDQKPVRNSNAIDRPIVDLRRDQQKRVL